MELDKLKKIIADVLNVDEKEITPNTKFVDDLGADSLDIFQIIMGIFVGIVVLVIIVAVVIAAVTGAIGGVIGGEVDDED